MELINFLLDCWLLRIIGAVLLVATVLSFLICVIFWFAGIAPVVLRLGKSLWYRKIAIFSDAIDGSVDLREALQDSGIFRAKNIIPINSKNIDKAKNITIFLVDWKSFEQYIDKIFQIRPNDQTPIIIYAEPESITPEVMTDIANRSNTIVVNFRGRLLNDVLISVITTHYVKRKV